MENANVQDTPQNANPQETSQAFETPQVAQDSSNELSVDDIILGNIDDTAPAFGQPEAGIQEQPSPPVDAKNDETRYEYWQSQAAKKENELSQMKAQQQQAMAMQQQQMMMQQQAQAQPEQEQFPDAPEKPNKPRSYSREEAYSDPSSESARYLDEVEEWRDDIEEYKDLRHQYDLALVQDKLNHTEEVRKNEIKRQQYYAAQQNKVAQVNNMVQSQYGLTPEESQKFITEMSSSDSLTMDNLVQLWRMKQGQGNPVGQPTQNNPSPTFQQTKRAQQIPSPMGTMPSTGNQAQNSTEDQIMDRMISDLDSKNPFRLK